jgi:hypothetical protein
MSRKRVDYGASLAVCLLQRVEALISVIKEIHWVTILIKCA